MILSIHYRLHRFEFTNCHINRVGSILLSIGQESPSFKNKFKIWYCTIPVLGTWKWLCLIIKKSGKFSKLAQHQNSGGLPTINHSGRARKCLSWKNIKNILKVFLLVSNISTPCMLILYHKNRIFIILCLYGLRTNSVWDRKTRNFEFIEIAEPTRIT